MFPRAHRPDVDLAVRRDDADLGRALKLVDGPLRHEQGFLSRFDSGAHLRVLTWAEDVPRIREYPLDRDRTRLRVDLAIGHDDGPAVRIDAAIVEDDLERGFGASSRLGPVVAPGGAQVLGLGDVELDFDWVLKSSGPNHSSELDWGISSCNPESSSPENINLLGKSKYGVIYDKD